MGPTPRLASLGRALRVRRLLLAPLLASRRRWDRDQAAADEQVGLARATGLEPAAVEPQGILLAAEQFERADRAEHAHEVGEAIGQLDERVAEAAAAHLRRELRVGVAPERRVVVRSDQPPVETVDEDARHEQRGVRDAPE